MYASEGARPVMQARVGISPSAEISRVDTEESAKIRDLGVRLGLDKVDHGSCVSGGEGEAGGGSPSLLEDVSWDW